MTNIEKLHEWYKLSRRREFIDTLDKDAAWNAIQNRIQSRKRTRILRLWGSVAAMTLLICSATIWWTSHEYENNEEATQQGIQFAQRMSKHEAQVSTTKEGCTISVPNGSEFSKDLTDGTKIVLNAGARLSYPSSFNSDKREVALMGEAYFEVAHNASKPFVVSTPSGSIEVLGTQFNVVAEAEQTTVTLQEGSVRLHFEGRDFMMKPGEQACMMKDGKFEIRQVNATNYTSWSTGMYEFNDVMLSEITHQLSLWYDVEITITDENLAESRYTGMIMRSETLESALNLLCVISDIKVKYKDSKIEICKK